MEKRSFCPPMQLSSMPIARYFPVAKPPTRFVSTQMTVGLKEFYQRINEGKCSTLVNENMDEEVFAPSLGRNYWECTPDTVNDLLAGRYRICGVLGKGQSSIMIKAKDTFHPASKYVAIKILHTSYSSLGPQEASCLLHIKKADTLKVSNTISILNVFTFGQHFCIVFELLRPTPLHEYFQTWSSSKALRIQLIRKIAFQVIQSLAVLSSLNIIHADIKPENILFQNEDGTKVKIIDFGNALYCVHDEMSLYFDEFDLQTIIYRAPEVMFGLPFGPQIDMWSLGCVLAEFFLGKPLFLGRTKEEILERMKSLLGLLPMCPFQSGKYFSHLKQFVGRASSVTAHCKVVGNLLKKLGTTDYTFADFIARLLTYDPSKRFDAFQAAHHPFLAPECAFGYFLPSKDMWQNTWRECSYSPIMLTPVEYLHRPKIDESIRKLHYSSIDLLHVGTKGAVDAKEIVVKVPPFKYKEDSLMVEDKNYVSQGNSITQQSTSSNVVVSQENIDGNDEITVMSSKETAVPFSAKKGYNKRKEAIKVSETSVCTSTTSLRPNLIGGGKSHMTESMKRKGNSRDKKHVLSSPHDQHTAVKRHVLPEKKRNKSSRSHKKTALRTHPKEKHTSKHFKDSMLCKKQADKTELAALSPGPGKNNADSQVNKVCQVRLNQEDEDMQSKLPSHPTSSRDKYTSKSSKPGGVLSFSQGATDDDSCVSDDYENCEVLLL